MAIYICPRCHSTNILPLFAKDNSWVCLDCGYQGSAQLINKDLEYFWKEYEKLENINKVNK